MTASTEELLFPPEVGRRLGVSTVEVLVLMDQGELPRIKGDDGLPYVPASAVDAYLQSRRRE